jgi:hypothetical protein
LGQAVRSVIDPKQKLGERDLIVLPRDAVNLYKPGSWMNHAMTLIVGADKFTVTPPLLTSGRRRKRMAELGWNFEGEVVPTGAPMHGGGFDRPGGPSEKGGPSAASRAGYIVAAIVLAVAVFALFVWLDR